MYSTTVDAMTLYPKLKKKLGLIGALCLIVWGMFILGMQVNLVFQINLRQIYVYN